MYFTACKLFFRFFNFVLVNIVKVNSRIDLKGLRMFSLFLIITWPPHVGAICCLLSSRTSGKQMVNHLNPIPFQSIFLTNFPTEAQATAKKEKRKEKASQSGKDPQRQ